MNASLEYAMMGVAWWISLYYILLGVYLVFVAEVPYPRLGMVFGFLGASIYMTILRPEWMFPELTNAFFAFMVLLALVLLGIESAVWIWKSNELARPDERIREFVRRGQS